jgi:hypothetical protein
MGSKGLVTRTHARMAGALVHGGTANGVLPCVTPCVPTLPLTPQFRDNGNVVYANVMSGDDGAWPIDRAVRLKTHARFLILITPPSSDLATRQPRLSTHAGCACDKPLRRPLQGLGHRRVRVPRGGVPQNLAWADPHVLASAAGPARV